MKRILSYVTLLAVLLSMTFHVPSVYAADPDPTETPSSGQADEDDPPIEGDDVREGELNGLKYLYNTEKAVIVGYEGTAPDVTIPAAINDLPVTDIAVRTFQNNRVVKNVVIEAGIKEIPKYCFSSSTIESVTFPGGLTSIGEYAFSGCYSLTGMALPEGTTSIGNDAFQSCNKLESIVLPEGVTSIGSYAFSGCTLLTDMTIPGSVTSMGSYAFRYCKSLGEVSVPGSVKAIPSYAFEGCAALETVTLSGGTTSISYQAFSSCTALNYIGIPASVTSISDGAFMYSNDVAIYGETGTYAETFAKANGIPFNQELEKGTENGFDYTVKNSEILTIVGYSGDAADITIPAKINGLPVAKIAAKAFQGKSKIKNVAIEQGIKEIPGYCFSSCYSLASVTFPEGLASIGERAFQNCTKLESIALPEGLTKIGYEAFDYCTALAEVTIPDTVTSMGSYVFESCRALKEISIPGSVKAVPSYAFRDCTALEAVQLGAGTTSIYSCAFMGCKNLASIYVPDSVLSISAGAFKGCNYVVMFGEEDSYAETYAEANGIPFNVDLYSGVYHGFEYTIKNGKKLTIVNYIGAESDVRVPAKIEGVTVTGIAERAFYNKNTIKNVVIEEGIKELPEYCFASCYSLEGITLPESITSIGRGAFSGCTKLKNIVLPERVTSIGNQAFSSCSSLKEVTIPEYVTSIGEYAFSGCYALESMAVPESVTKMGWGVFESCTSLKEISVPGSVKTIPPYAFMSCTALKKVQLESGITTIGGEAFTRCTKLEEIDMPDSLVEIDSGAFRECTKLVNVTLPDGMMRIRAEAFCDCAKLQTIYIPASVTSFGSDIFKHCYFLAISSYKGSDALKYADENGIKPSEIKKQEDNDGDKDGDEDEVSIKEPSDYVGMLDDGMNLFLIDNFISVKFDADATRIIKNQHGTNDVILKYIPPKKSTVGGDLGDILGKFDVIMRLKLEDPDGNKIPFSSGDKGGKAEVTIPYKAPERANKISVYYVDNDGNVKEVESEYDPVKEQITFTTDSFAYFGILAETVGSVTVDGTTSVTADYKTKEVRTEKTVIGMLEPTKHYSDENTGDLKWVLEKPDGKKSGAAKFKDDKGNFRLSEIADVESVEIGAFKAEGLFNSTVVIKAVSKDYDAAKKTGKVYAEFVLYINPAYVTGFKHPEQEITNGRGVRLTVPIDNECDLTIPEGVSFKLPFAAKNGADKTLTYTSDSACFTVSNGKVRGLTAGKGTIIIKPVDGDCSMKVNVTVVGNIKKIRASVSSITVAPGLAQEFTVSPSVASNLVQKLTLVFSKDAGAYDVKYSTDNGGKWKPLNTNANANANANTVEAAGAVLFRVELKKGSAVTKGEKILITSDQNGGKAKAAISVKDAAAPQNVKSFKEKIKKPKNEQFRTLNIPVGSTGNIGVSVRPASADSRFRLYETDENGKAEGSSSGKISINGDTIKALEAGTAYVQAVTEGIDANSKNVKSDIYKINVYVPASSFVFDDVDMTVKGGYLMEKEEASTSCDKTVEGGKSYTFDTPDCGAGNEPVEWASSNSGSVALDVKGRKMTVKVIAPGTYTVSGVSKYTKQKFKFKVKADEKENKEVADSVIEYRKKGTTTWYKAGSVPVELTVGSTMEIRSGAEEICGKVSFSSAGGAVSVNKKGVVKAKKASDAPVDITATVGSTSTKISVKPVAVEKSANVKVNVPSYAAANKALKVSTSLGKDAKWYYYVGAEIKPLTVSSGLPSGKYRIFPSKASSEKDVTLLDRSRAKEINVYSKLATAASVLDPSEKIIKSDGTYVKEKDENAVSIKDLAKADKGVEGGRIIVLPVNATLKEQGKAVMADVDAIKWETSNSNLAVVKKLSSYGIVEDSSAELLYGKYALEVNSNGYTGKVVLTGILKNGGKKIKVKLNVKE